MVGVAESDIHIIFAGYAILPYSCKLVTTCTCLYTGGSRHPHEQHFLKKEVPSILVVKLQQRAVHCTRRGIVVILSCARKFWGQGFLQSKNK